MHPYLWIGHTEAVTLTNYRTGKSLVTIMKVDNHYAVFLHFWRKRKIFWKHIRVIDQDGFHRLWWSGNLWATNMRDAVNAVDKALEKIGIVEDRTNDGIRLFYLLRDSIQDVLFEF